MRNERKYTWLTYPQLYSSVFRKRVPSAPAQRGWAELSCFVKGTMRPKNIYIYYRYLVQKVVVGGNCEKDKGASWKQVNMEAR